MALRYSQNFDALSAGATVSGWSNNWVVTTTNPTSGSNAFTSGNKTNGDSTVFTGISAMADFDIVTSQKVTVNSGSFPNIGVAARCDTGFANGYLVLLGHSGTVGTAVIQVFKKVGGSFTSISGSNNVAGINVGDIVKIRFQVQGTSIQVKVWDSSLVTEPTTWNVVLTDTSVTANGYAGLYYGLDGQANGTTISVDDITVSDFAAGSITIPQTDPGFFYSPGNWNNGVSINAGAYFKTLVSGSVGISLLFDVSAVVAPFPEIWYRIDKFGGWTKTNIAASISCAMPGDTGNWSEHLVEVIIKSTTQTLNRWSAGPTGIKFQGVSVDSTGVLTKPSSAPLKILIFGDSITEGVRTLNNTATNDTDQNDAAMGWAYQLGSYLGAEVGVIGFGSQGFAVQGSGSVPIFQDSLGYIYSGVARDFTGIDLVVINMGTNDGSTAATSYIVTAFNNLLSFIPSTTKIAVLRPFNGSQAANIQSAIAQSNAPNRFNYIDTTGFFNTSYSSDGLHPYGFTDVSTICPAIASALKPIINPKGMQFHKMY